MRTQYTMHLPDGRTVTLYKVNNDIRGYMVIINRLWVLGVVYFSFKTYKGFGNVFLDLR